MMGREIVEEKPVTLSEVRRILEKQEKERGELTYEQKITLDYAKEFGKMAASKVKDAMKEFTEMGVDDKAAAKLIDIRPKTKEEVKIIFEKVRFDLKDAQIKKILDTVQDL